MKHANLPCREEDDTAVGQLGQRQRKQRQSTKGAALLLSLLAGRTSIPVLATDTYSGSGERVLTRNVSTGSK